MKIPGILFGSYNEVIKRLRPLKNHNIVFMKNIKIYSPVWKYIGYFLIGYLLFEKPLNMKKWQK